MRPYPRHHAARGGVTIDRCRPCRLLLSTFAARTGDPSDRRAPLCAFASGECLATRYRISKLLGTGGMGEVYEALDTASGKTIALKTIAVRAPMDDAAVARLEAEVRMARRVMHPNVCRVFDMGVHRPSIGVGIPIPFFTMELLRGETLGSHLRRAGPLPAREALLLLEQVAAGVEATHRAGIVHADLKSDNLMLMPGHGGTRCVITDFGLARPLGFARPLGVGRRSVAGTMGYMAPEQMEGRPTVPATDVYALGVVLFEMMTGRLPSGARSWRDAKLEAPGAPPLRLGALGVAAPAAWDATIARSLHPVARERFGEAGALVDTLRAALQSSVHSDHQNQTAGQGGCEMRNT